MPRVGVTTCAVRSTARAGRRPAFQAGDAIKALDRPTGLRFHSNWPALHRVVALCCHQWHNDSMAIQITVRNVAESVRNELAARAALRGQSMQEFLRGELERIASRPSVDLWLEGVRRRKEAAGTRVARDRILDARDSDRR